MNILYTTENSNTPSLSSATLAIPSNKARISWSIQNMGTNPLYVRLGGAASTTVFHAALAGGTAVDDGLGAQVFEGDGAVFTGDIRVAGTAIRYVVLEEAP